MPVKSQPLKKTLFIVDDHPIVRAGLTQLINQEADLLVVGSAAETEEALREIARLKPDLAIVDISLQGASGIELTKSIVSQYPEILVLIISMYDESLHLERALRAGAKGYLTKHEATDHVVTAIRKLFAGDIYLSAKWRDKLLNSFVGRAPAGATSRPLTDRELEVLQLIGQGHSTRKIAGELHVSAKTIESHYANIKAKLDLKNSHELIQYAVKWLLTER